MDETRVALLSGLFLTLGWCWRGELPNSPLECREQNHPRLMFELHRKTNKKKQQQQPKDLFPQLSLAWRGSDLCSCPVWAASTFIPLNRKGWFALLLLFQWVCVSGFTPIRSSVAYKARSLRNASTFSCSAVNSGWWRLKSSYKVIRFYDMQTRTDTQQFTVQFIHLKRLQIKELNEGKDKEVQ